MHGRLAGPRGLVAATVSVLLLATQLATAGAAEPSQTPSGDGPGRGMVTAGSHPVLRDVAGEERGLLGRGPAPVAPPLAPWSGALRAGTSAVGTAAQDPVQATTSDNPPIALDGFAGLARSSGAATDREPPGSDIAVGPEHVVQVVNGALSATDRSGASTYAASLGFFVGTFDFSIDPPATTVWSDPRIVYDAVRGRFLLSVSGLDCASSAAFESDHGTGFTFIATTDTLDPGGTWTGGYLYWPDQLPEMSSLGTTSDRFVTGANVYDLTDPACSTAYVGGDLTFITWANWLSGWTTFGWDSLPGTYFSPVVAEQTPASSTRTHVIAQFDDGVGGLNVRYLTYTTFVPFTTAEMVPQRNADLSAAGIMTEAVEPPDPIQPGPDVVTTDIDARPLDAVWQGGRLVVVSTHGCIPAGDATLRACTRITELDTTGVSASVSPALAQDLLVAADGGDAYAGGATVTGNGTLVVTWTHSSSAPGDFPSSYAAYQLPSDPIHVLSAPELLAAGTAVYEGTRWGRFNGLGADPQVPSAAWQANQFAAGGSEWQTHVSQLRSAGTTYVPITPIRTLDTRNGTGLTGRFVHGTPRTWSIAGVGPIPDDAVAVSANVTVTGQEAAGYVSVTPTPIAIPPSSTVNFPAGDNRANNLVVALAADGRVSAVYRASSGKRTHVLFDVTGYFIAADDGTTFTPHGPVRALDSRNGTGGYDTPFSAAVPRLVPIADAKNGIPDTATAITGNLTVVAQTGPGYLSVTPEAVARPGTSNLNFPVGDVRANGVFAPLNAEGDVHIVLGASAGRTAHVVLDVTGYFEPGEGGLRFVPLNPGRIMDTRIDRGAIGSSVLYANDRVYVDFAGHWGVGSDAMAVTGNLTVVGPTRGGYVSVLPYSTAGTPQTSTINFKAREIKPNGLVTPLDEFSGVAYFYYVAGGSGYTDVVFDLSGFFE